MPEIGEVKHTIRKSRNTKIYATYSWMPCEICGNPRWERIINGVPRRNICQPCSTKRTYRYRQLEVDIENPKIGDRVKGWRINKYPKAYYVFVECPDCHKKRWVQYSNLIARKTERCYPCAMKTPEHAELIRNLMLDRLKNGWMPPHKRDGLIPLEKVPHPDIGDVCRGRDIGMINDDAKHKYVWSICPNCKIVRWVRAYKVTDIKSEKICKNCSSAVKLKGKSLTEAHREKLRGRFREKHQSWKGERRINKQGYVLLSLKRDDPYFVMCNKNGIVLEHRLIMAKHLGRLLEIWEVVHHIDGNRQNNELSNLYLANAYEHLAITNTVKKELRVLLKENRKMKRFLKLHYKYEMS